jgi:hypothetical protein
LVGLDRTRVKVKRWRRVWTIAQDLRVSRLTRKVEANVKRNGMKPRTVEEWIERHGQLGGLISVLWVTSAEALCEHMTSMVEEKKYAMLFKGGTIEEWSRLYSRALLDGSGVWGILQSMPGCPPADLRESAARQIETAQSEEDLNGGPIVDLLRRYYLEDPGEVGGQVSGGERAQVLGPLFGVPEAVFVCKIFLPCILYYHTTPHVLLEKARRADLASFEQLLSLDHNVLAIPGLEGVWEGFARDPQGAALKRVKAAINNPPYKNRQPEEIRGRIKVVIAFLIERIFKADGRPISRMEIRDLYDLVAKESGRGEIDSDLPETENGFDEALRREGKAWDGAVSDLA